MTCVRLAWLACVVMHMGMAGRTSFAPIRDGCEQQSEEQQVPCMAGLLAECG